MSTDNVVTIDNDFTTNNDVTANNSVASADTHAHPMRTVLENPKWVVDGPWLLLL